MTEKERLEKLLKEAEEFLGKNLTRDDSKFKAWNNALIRFCEKKYGENSSITKDFTKRLYTYSICSIGTPHSSFVKKFEEDLNTTIEDLKLLIDECEDDFYNLKREDKNDKKNSSLPINVNITNNNNNSNNNNINILTPDEIREKIEDNTYLDDKAKEELYKKLIEIEELQQSNESKSKKWNKARKILEFVLDKGADIAIMFIPQILKGIS